jgi:hypothetical protein
MAKESPFPIPMLLAAITVGWTLPIILHKLDELKITVSYAGYRNEKGEWMDYDSVTKALLS